MKRLEKEFRIVWGRFEVIIFTVKADKIDSGK